MDMATKTQAQRDREWEIEEAARILVRAEEIKADEKLFNATQKYLARQKKTIDKAVQSAKNRG